MFDIFSSVMFDGNITHNSLESPFFKDLNDACCISGGQIQPAKIKFKSTTKSDMLSYIVLPFLNHTILLFSVEALQLLIFLLHLNAVISIISTPLYCKAPL